MYEVLSYLCMRRQDTSGCGLKLLVYVLQVGASHALDTYASPSLVVSTGIFMCLSLQLKASHTLSAEGLQAAYTQGNIHS